MSQYEWKRDPGDEKLIDLANQIDRLLLGVMSPIQPAWIDSAIELLRESATELRSRGQSTATKRNQS